MLVKLILRETYGRPLFYPDPESDIAKLLCAFCNRMSMTKKQVDILIEYGWDVELTQPNIKEMK
jgi:hypothetical protein